MSSQAIKARLERLARATAAKLAEKAAILREYEEELEQVGPAPGRAWEQHDTMVRFSSIIAISLSLAVRITILLTTEPVAGVARAVRGCSEGPGR